MGSKESLLGFWEARFDTIQTIDSIGLSSFPVLAYLEISALGILGSKS
jgi:hypothetical protein